MKIEERWVCYFVWKSIAISHTIPDYPSILSRGTSGLIKDIEEKLAKDPAGDETRRHTLTAMKRCLQGLTVYAEHCAEEAAARAAQTSDPARREERPAWPGSAGYRGLLVRISGYNACFVTLNREMKIELIKRAECGLGAAGEFRPPSPLTPINIWWPEKILT